MQINRKLAVVLGLGAVTAAALPVLAQRGPTSGPVAKYDMRAGTVSGFSAMGSGMGAAMGMMFGGGGGDKVQRELYLRLGSSQAPAKGGPKADHFMPPVAKLGKSVALVTPTQERGPVNELPGERQGQKPQGRLLIFWGCGEHAPKGQPVIFDFAKIYAGQIPQGAQGVWSASIPADWGPTIQNSKTFGRWPAEDGKFVKPESSLIGPHRVAASYSPEIAFNLSKDFMAPLRTTRAQQASGATLLSWNAVPEATGYIATLFGGKMAQGGQMGDMVMWTSSSGRQFGGGLTDWLTPGQVSDLVKSKTVLPPSATTCLIPAEVKKAAPDFAMGMMTAYGPQEDFAYPPRPADAKAPWHLQWTARIRHRSTTSWMDMAGMPGQAAQDGQQQPQQCKPKKGLGGILGGVLKPGSC